MAPLSLITYKESSLFSPLRSESPLGVDVQTFALCAAHVDGQLTRDGESVTQLRLARSKFAKEFGYGAGFNAWKIVK